jgi:hypothetical protein
MMEIWNKNTGPDFKQNNNPGLVFFIKKSRTPVFMTFFLKLIVWNIDIHICLLDSTFLCPHLLYTKRKTTWNSADKISCSGKICKEQVVLTHCRICHTKMINNCILNVEPRSECIQTNSFYTIEHFKLTMTDVRDIRRAFYTPNRVN